MNEEINKIIDSLEGCIGMFDYMITPIESNLLVSYIRELKQQNKKYKEVIDKAKSLNEEISHIIYEDFLEENVIGCKYLYERIKKQLDILKEVK